jgi:hypothetical protein
VDEEKRAETSWDEVERLGPYQLHEQVESPWSEAPARQSAESLVFAFEALRDGVRRMARHLPDSDEPRSGWRLGWGLAGAAAVCALLCALAQKGLSLHGG